MDQTEKIAILLQSVKWNEQGLVCAVAQDQVTKRVLMVAWMNEEALIKTMQTGFAHYYSRSRKKQWQKGEESGHIQKISGIRLDCDGDTLLLQIDQIGSMACHTGRESCFYRVLNNAEWQVVDPILKDESLIYTHSHQ